MTDVNNSWKMRGKQASPEETVARAQGILEKYGFQASLEETSHAVEDCYSCRLTLCSSLGEALGSNGKGMTLMLSHASAYGELMERLQNRQFFHKIRYDDPAYEEISFPENPIYSPRDENQPKVMRDLKKCLISSIGMPMTESVTEELVNGMIEKLIPLGMKGFSTLPFYSVTEDRTVYLPIDLIQCFCGSNGMAAGNTLEEALVEGISEILERYVELQFLEGRIVPPQVPRSEIAKYPHIEKVIREIEGKGDFSVRVLDLSMGKGIPALCGIIIHKNKGNFSICFGAHPSFSIALERLFTESFQGVDLEKRMKNAYVELRNHGRTGAKSKDNLLSNGIGCVSPTFILDRADYEFHPWPELKTDDNKEIAAMLIRKLEELGADVYIRNASYMGFPAVYIYARGVSEVSEVSVKFLNAFLRLAEAQEFFLRMDQLSEKDVKKLEELILRRRGLVGAGKINVMSQLHFDTPLPGAPFDMDVLLTACRYRLRHFREAADSLNSIVSDGNQNMDPMEKAFWIAAKLYMDALADEMTEEDSETLIRNLCPDTAEKVLDIFRDPEKILERLYPNIHSLSREECQRCHSRYPEVHDLYAKLIRIEKEYPADPMAFREIAKRR